MIASKVGKRCLVIEKRKFAGGNIRCENIEGINCHIYGPHIFHTDDIIIWNYVNQFVSFNNFIYSPLANYNDQLYNLPFNMNTFYQLWGVKTPIEAKALIEKQSAGINKPENLEEQAIKLVGYDVYEKLIKGYTEKQWGRACSQLPSFIIKRLPVRFIYDNNYFNDRYQGIPIGGYNRIIEGLLKNIEVRLETNYLENKVHFDSLAERIVYTGAIDEYYNYQFGELEYRSLSFKSEIIDTENYQGNAVINYTSGSVPYTRMIEHKHFEKTNSPVTVITYEYPQKWYKGMDAFYPVNDETNNLKFKKYKELATKESIIFGGRLAEYRYYDMHQIIAAALKKASEILGLNSPFAQNN